MLFQREPIIYLDLGYVTYSLSLSLKTFEIYNELEEYDFFLQQNSNQTISLLLLSLFLCLFLHDVVSIVLHRVVTRRAKPLPLKSFETGVRWFTSAASYFVPDE